MLAGRRFRNAQQLIALATTKFNWHRCNRAINTRNKRAVAELYFVIGAWIFPADKTNGPIVLARPCNSHHQSQANAEHLFRPLGAVQISGCYATGAMGRRISGTGDSGGGFLLSRKELSHGAGIPDWRCNSMVGD